MEKTTTIINLGAALAALNAPTLLVDADPQCNLTSYFLRPEPEEDEKDDTELHQHGDDQQPSSPQFVPDTDTPEFEMSESEQEDVRKDKVKEKERETASSSRPLASTSPATPPISVVDIALQCETDKLKHDKRFPPELNPRTDNTSPSLHSLIQPVFDADVSGLKILSKEQLHCISANLYLLPGSANIVEFESYLAKTDDSTRDLLLGQLYLTVFRKTIIDVAKTNGYNLRNTYYQKQ